MPFLYKYVDDLICSVLSENVLFTLNAFNSFNQKLQFTVEHEKDCGVPFLDTKVIKTNNIIILDWYKKPTASAKFLNYYSNHPQHQKYNTIILMKNRVTQINNSFLNRNLKGLYNVLK